MVITTSLSVEPFSSKQPTVALTSLKKNIMNYNLSTLCANFSRGAQLTRTVRPFSFAFHLHTKSQRSETIIFPTVLLQPVFSHCEALRVVAHWTVLASLNPSSLF